MNNLNTTAKEMTVNQATHWGRKHHKRTLAVAVKPTSCILSTISVQMHSEEYRMPLILPMTVTKSWWPLVCTMNL